MATESCAGQPRGWDTGRVPIYPVTDPDDERLADYFRLTDVALRRRLEPAQGLYMAES